MFNKMYESMNAVRKFSGENPSKPGEGFNELLENANRDIENYIKNRDSFIKWTHKGRERLKICKDFIETNKILRDQYAELSKELLDEHAVHQRAHSEKADDIVKQVKPSLTEQGHTKVSDKNLENSSMGIDKH